MAIYLKDMGVEPVVFESMVFESMPRFMCEKAYENIIKERGIEYNTNVQVMEIKGDTKVESLVYKDRATGKVKEVPVDDVFIYVGLIPISGLAKSLGVETDERGYIKVDPTMRTNVPRIYAAGDVTGYGGQIIIAAGQGALAALSAYEDLC